jgi:hypothetical protein
MKKLVFVLGMLLLSLPMMAESKSSDFKHGKHSLRLGWGLGTRHLFHDYEDLNLIMPPSHIQGVNKITRYDNPYYDLLRVIMGMTAEEAHQFLTNYRLVVTNGPKQSGHLFLGYRYDVNSWFSAGAEVDWFYLWSNSVHRNGYGEIVGTYDYHLHQLTIMPSIRFTYFRRPLVELYSGLGLGYTMYEGSYGVQHGFTFSPTLFGVNVGNEHWFAEMELGGMATVTTSWFGNPGVLFSSRLLSVAVGYRF